MIKKRGVSMLFIAGDHSTARDGEYDQDRTTPEEPFFKLS